MVSGSAVCNNVFSLLLSTTTGQLARNVADMFNPRMSAGIDSIPSPLNASLACSPC